jgi:hypothetical protein
VIPVYGVGGNQTPAERVAAETNDDLLPDGRKFLTKIVTSGIQWTANQIMEQVAGAEAADETLASYDTNDWRVWNAIFSSLIVFLNTPQEVPQKGGLTKVITPQDAVMKFYSRVPAQG